MASMRSPVCTDAPLRTSCATKAAMPRHAMADPASNPTSTRRYRSWPAAVTTTNVITLTTQHRAMRVTAECDDRLRHCLRQHEQHASRGQEAHGAMSERVLGCVQDLGP